MSIYLYIYLSSVYQSTYLLSKYCLSWYMRLTDFCSWWLRKKWPAWSIDYRDINSHCFLSAGFNIVSCNLPSEGWDFPFLFTYSLWKIPSFLKIKVKKTVKQNMHLRFLILLYNIDTFAKYTTCKSESFH